MSRLGVQRLVIVLVLGAAAVLAVAILLQSDAPVAAKGIILGVLLGMTVGGVVAGVRGGQR